MAFRSTNRFSLLVVANIAVFCVLGFWQSSGVAQRDANQPFANAVQQRMEMINQLKELNAQLKEQNALLRSGKLQVMIVEKQR